MASKADLSPPPNEVTDFGFVWRQWFNYLFERIGGTTPFKIRGYTVAGLPSATDWASSTAGQEFTGLVYVTDEVGGATLAFSDGTNWRRVQDRVIVS